MFEYEKPLAEVINLIPADKMMSGWDEWGSNEDWDVAEDDGWD